ncbi:MAG: ABC transporter substrate-binding protein [Desulfuromonadales bacterium]|nr:ABC transporter substrate-binding protein [Desulfuromonadales bacterium]
MTASTPNRRIQSMTVSITFFVLVLFGISLSNSSAEPTKENLAPQEQLRLGERIYREGILSSGESMQAVIKGDISVPGTSFACVSCHLRSGIGSYEGGVVTPPINGSRLFQPLKMEYKRSETDQKYFPTVLVRPAFSDETLAKALRRGIDPTGKTLNPVMPRYILGDTDMALLISYLRTLSAQFSPGASDTTLNFATVITDDVPPEQYEAMLAPLEQYVQHKNSMINLFKKEKRSERMAAVMLNSAELMYKKMTLSRWMLKGAPETWRSQLEEYYRKQPVFALVGGISHGDWKPIHDFSEAHQLPCLFPQTDFPVISESDWYTLYLSKGYYQEGEGAARYLNNRDELSKGGKVLQLVRASHDSQALSQGFLETWRELGHDTPVTIPLNAGQPVSKEYLQQLLEKAKPAAILLWDDAGALSLLEQLATDVTHPVIAIVSGTQQKTNLAAIPEKARVFTYITFPFRLPQDEQRNSIYIEPYKKNPKTDDAVDPILKRSFIATQMLTAALMDLRGNYYRDGFFDVIGMMADQKYPLYERLSFGPGQRYASKGCYIVQLGSGAKPDLIKKSDWVIH